METRIYRPEHWHQRAEELRSLAAEAARDLDSRSLLKQIADEYDLLAKRAEDRLRASPHKPAGAAAPRPRAAGWGVRRLTQTSALTSNVVRAFYSRFVSDLLTIILCRSDVGTRNFSAAVSTASSSSSASTIPRYLSLAPSSTRQRSIFLFPMQAQTGEAAGAP
jgi:hypothetical protein